MDFKREIVLQVSLLFALGIFFYGLNDILSGLLLSRNHEVKCDNPGISKPLVMDYEWIVNSVTMTRQYIVPIFIGLNMDWEMKSKQGAGIFFNFLLTMIPSMIFLNGFAATVAVVTTISSFWGSLAPNFLAASQPHLLHGLCQLKYIAYLSKLCPTCTTFQMSARSAFPSNIPTLQAFNMCFLALYIGYRMNTLPRGIWFSANRYFRYLIQLCALIFTLVTGFVTIHRNEADHLGVWIGCLIGISSAVVAMAALKGLEGRIQKRLQPMNDPASNDPPIFIPLEQDDAALHDNPPVTKKEKPTVKTDSIHKYNLRNPYNLRKRNQMNVGCRCKVCQ